MTFPTLVPAFTALVPIKPPHVIGNNKGGLHHAIIMDTASGNAGSFKSEPGYAVPVDAHFVHGADFIRPDADGKHLRLNVDAILQDNESDGLLHYQYTGIVAVTPAIGKVLTGAPDAATVPFGSVFTQISFESSHPAFAPLEHKTFVAAGRFIVEAGQPVVVEYHISEVTI